MAAAKWGEFLDPAPAQNASPFNAYRRSKPNHIQIVGAATTPVMWVPPNNTAQKPQFELGFTIENWPVHASYILRERIQYVTTTRIPDPNNALNSFEAPEFGYSQNVESIVRRVLAHEMTHQFLVNAPIASTGGHCGEMRWDDPARACLMHKPFLPTPQQDRGMVADGVLKLHYVHTAGSPVRSEYMDVRDADDPMRKGQ
jgi:hypothetical protein